MRKPKRKKPKKLKPLPPGRAPVRTAEEKRSIYRIFTQGIRAKLMGRRVLEDLTTDISQYEDTRVPTTPGKTIKNPFKAYPWKNSSYDTRKG